MRIDHGLTRVPKDPLMEVESIIQANLRHDRDQRKLRDWMDPVAPDFHRGNSDKDNHAIVWAWLNRRREDDVLEVDFTRRRLTDEQVDRQTEAWTMETRS